MPDFLCTGSHLWRILCCDLNEVDSGGGPMQYEETVLMQVGPPAEDLIVQAVAQWFMLGLA